ATHMPNPISAITTSDQTICRVFMALLATQGAAAAHQIRRKLLALRLSMVLAVHTQRAAISARALQRICCARWLTHRLLNARIHLRCSPQRLELHAHAQGATARRDKARTALAAVHHATTAVAPLAQCCPANFRAVYPSRRRV